VSCCSVYVESFPMGRPSVGVLTNTTGLIVPE
jgi:hypothetical protein